MRAAIVARPQRTIMMVRKPAISKASTIFHSGWWQSALLQHLSVQLPVNDISGRLNSIYSVTSDNESLTCDEPWALFTTQMMMHLICQCLFSFVSLWFVYWSLLSDLTCSSLSVSTFNELFIWAVNRPLPLAVEIVSVIKMNSLSHSCLTLCLIDCLHLKTQRDLKMIAQGLLFAQHLFGWKNISPSEGRDVLGAWTHRKFFRWLLVRSNVKKLSPPLPVCRIEWTWRKLSKTNDWLT